MEQSGKSNQPPRARRWARRWTLRAAAALALLAATALGLYGTRQHTLHPLLDRAAPALSRWFSPVEVRLSRIEGDWRRQLAIEGLELRARDGAEGPLRRLEVQRAEVRGDLLAAAIGGDPDALEAVIAAAPRVQLALASDAGTGGRTKDPSGRSPHVDVTRGSVRLEGLDETIEIDGLELSGRGSTAVPLELEGEFRAPGWSAHLLGRLRFEDAGALRFVLDAPEARAGEIEAAAIGVAGSWAPDGTRLDDGRIVVGKSQLGSAGSGSRPARRAGLRWAGR